MTTPADEIIIITSRMLATRTLLNNNNNESYQILCMVSSSSSVRVLTMVNQIVLSTETSSRGVTALKSLQELLLQLLLTA